MPKPAPSEPLEDVLARLEALYTRTDEDQPSTNGTNGHHHAASIQVDQSMFPLLVAICLIPHNDPSDYARLFSYFADRDDDPTSRNTIHLPRLVWRLRTALFKAVPLVGVPRIINALAALHEAVLAHPDAEEIFTHIPTHSTKPTKTTEEDHEAGWAFFKAIYAQHAEKIIEKIGKTSPDLAEMIVDELYGSNLSRREVLSWQDTVLIEFTGW